MNFDSDTDILAHTMRDGETLRFPGELMCDKGRDIIGTVSGDLTASKISSWCEGVRGENRARQEKQNATTRRETAAPAAVDGEKNTPSEDGGGSNEAAKDSLPTSQKEVEALLRESICRLEERIDDLRGVISAAEVEEREAWLQKERLNRALQAYSTFDEEEEL